MIHKPGTIIPLNLAMFFFFFHIKAGIYIYYLYIDTSLDAEEEEKHSEAERNGCARFADHEEIETVLKEKENDGGERVHHLVQIVCVVHPQGGVKVAELVVCFQQ